MNRFWNRLPQCPMYMNPQSQVHHDLFLTRCLSNLGSHDGAENTSKYSMNFLRSSLVPTCLGNHSLSSSEQLNKCQLYIPQAIPKSTDLSSMVKINSNLSLNADFSPSVVMYLPTIVKYPKVEVEVVPDDDSSQCDVGKSCRSVLKQRRKKMNKHKYRKWRRKMRFVRRALGR